MEGLLEYNKYCRGTVPAAKNLLIFLSTCRDRVMKLCASNSCFVIARIQGLSKNSTSLKLRSY